jgi:hypothetical protein
MARATRMMLLAIVMLWMANIARGYQASTDDHKMDRAVLAAVVSLQCQGKDRGKVLLSSKPSAPDEVHRGHPNGISDIEIAELISRTNATDALPTGIGCSRVRMESYSRIKAAFDKPAKHPVKFPAPIGVLIPIGANTGFTDAFPDIGILLRLSMPVYSPAKDMAVVYFSEDCGGLCAHGEYVVLQQVEGVWRVMRRVQAWTS